MFNFFNKQKQEGDSPQLLSTTQISKQHDINPKTLFAFLKSKNLIGSDHKLTAKGTQAGGTTKEGFDKVDTYIVWPKDLLSEALGQDLQAFLKAYSEKINQPDDYKFSTTKVSTSKLATKYGIPPKALFAFLEQKSYLKDGQITPETSKIQGEMREGFGDIKNHVVWPENLLHHPQTKEEFNTFLSDASASQKDKTPQDRKPEKEVAIDTFALDPKKLSITQIAKGLELDQKLVFDFLTQEKLIDASKLPTQSCKKYGGEIKQGNGYEYGAYPINFLEHPDLYPKLKAFWEATKNTSDTSLAHQKTPPKTPIKDFRKVHEASFRSDDGHYVRSKAEQIICSWLYNHHIAHAYEKKLPVEENLYSDFYIKQGNVYIEYWGLENDERYNKRKQDKLGIYSKHGFSLIELNDDDIKQIDDVLPQKLLKFGIRIH